jgi:hypothetical protein
MFSVNWNIFNDSDPSVLHEYFSRGTEPEVPLLFNNSVYLVQVKTNKRIPDVCPSVRIQVHLLIFFECQEIS